MVGKGSAKTGRPFLMPNKFYAYDIEVLKNYFSVTFIDVKTRQDKHVFVISPWRNDYQALADFLFQEDLKLVGFNNLGYDYPVIHTLISNDLTDWSGDDLVALIYDRSTTVLSEDWRKDFEAFIIPQLDLFRVWHFNNKARYTSLKYLQINMDWPDVSEMPFHHSHKVKPGVEEELLLAYNTNDVLSTIEFYYRSLDRIKMRKVLGEKYGKDFRNSPDTKIGESIFLAVMSKITGKSERELASRKTERPQIHLKDAIPEGVYFASDQFGSVLKQFQEKVITNTRKEETISVVFDGLRYDFGFGGLHALRAPGVYTDIDTADVGGYYPSLSISKNIYPHHLGPAFPQGHKVIKEERAKYPKGTPESDGLKLAGNGAFGMMNAPWSPFYDPLAAMKTTIGGQLLLAQLCEWITMSNAGTIVMANTDGFEVLVKNRERYNKMCELWQKEHNLTLEFGRYKKIAIRDVNNYIGVKEDGKVKEKGDYVTKPELYKDQSMKIVRQAVREYFVNDVPVEKTIGEANDIKLFVMGRRAKTGNLEWREAKTLTELIREPLPKTVRYYVSKSGGSIVKVLKAPKKKLKKDEVFDPDQLSLFSVKATKTEDQIKIVNIHAGWRVTLFNKWVNKPFEEYGIEKNFYINEAKKLIDPIIKQQSQF